MKKPKGGWSWQSLFNFHLMLEYVILISFCILIFSIYYFFEFFRNYLKVIVSIAIFGSLFFNFYQFDFLELLSNWNKPENSWRKTIFFSDIHTSLILSTLLSSVSIVPLYFMEKKRTNYVTFNLLIFLINFGTLIFVLKLNKFDTKEIQEIAFNFFLFYYVPGIVAYYFFVYRPRKRNIK